MPGLGTGASKTARPKPAGERLPTASDAERRRRPPPPSDVQRASPGPIILRQSRWGLLDTASCTHATRRRGPRRGVSGVGFVRPGPLVKGQPAIVSAPAHVPPRGVATRTLTWDQPHRRRSPSGHPRAHEGGPRPRRGCGPEPVGVPRAPRACPPTHCAGFAAGRSLHASDRSIWPGRRLGLDGAGRSDQGYPSRGGDVKPRTGAPMARPKPGCRGGRDVLHGTARTGRGRMPRRRRRLGRAAAYALRSLPRARSSPADGRPDRGTAFAAEDDGTRGRQGRRASRRAR